MTDAPPDRPEPAASDPRDAGLVEARVQSTPVYAGHFLQVRSDRVRLPDGALAGREYIVHPGAVMIVPIADDGRLVVERQYRYPIGQVLLEFPAGKRDPGETTLACAQRELAEETGYRAREWAHAGRLHNAPAYATEAIDIWFARGLVSGPPHRDAGEFLEVLLMAQHQLLDLVGRRELTDAKTMVALLWLQNWQSGAFPLMWQDA